MISATTGHTIGKDRMVTHYVSTDIDVKIAINLRFNLHINKKMFVSRNGIIYEYYLKK